MDSSPLRSCLSASPPGSSLNCCRGGSGGFGGFGQGAGDWPHWAVGRQALLPQQRQRAVGPRGQPSGRAARTRPHRRPTHLPPEHRLCVDPGLIYELRRHSRAALGRAFSGRSMARSARGPSSVQHCVASSRQPNTNPPTLQPTHTHTHLINDAVEESALEVAQLPCPLPPLLRRHRARLARAQLPAGAGGGRWVGGAGSGCGLRLAQAR